MIYSAKLKEKLTVSISNGLPGSDVVDVFDALWLREQLRMSQDVVLK
jgi:hypothetical protein